MLRIALLSLVVSSGLTPFATPAPVAASTTFTVNRIGDQPDLNLANAACDVSSNSGSQCTLRAAIQEANDTPGVDTINFNITSASKVITPASPLPIIGEPVTINGFSQSGASANTRTTGNNASLVIVLDGLNAGADAIGLELRGSDSTVRGLVIQRFDGPGIVLAGGGDHLIAGNFIGTNAAGDTARGNDVGVFVNSRGNSIGGTTNDSRNLISGNDANGIAIRGELGSENVIQNVVQNNYIGTRKAGGAALGNGLFGVGVVDAPESTVGGTTAATRNVISGNVSDGVVVVRSEGSVVRGNFIGTNAEGNADVGNGRDGVQIANDGTDVVVGGMTAAARNVISGNDNDGVGLVALVGAKVIGNFIGTNAAGTAALGNAADGISFFSARQSAVGCADPACRNVISANDGIGIAMDAGSDNNTVQGNRIGTKADGTGDLGNGGAGVRALGSDNLIGGSTSPAGNTIANSGGNGVEWFFPDATGNAVQGNAIIGNGSHGVSVKTGPASVLGNVIVANGGDGVENRFAREVRIQGNQILGNTGLGIDLAGGTNGDGVTPNDNDDPDTGSNDRQNFPVLAQAVRNSQGVTIVSGTLNSNPSKTFRIELFIAATDPSGHGEGQILIATQNVSTNSSGDASFTFVSSQLAPGLVLTATATEQTTGNTSEFSANRVVAAGP